MSDFNVGDIVFHNGRLFAVRDIITDSEGEEALLCWNTNEEWWIDSDACKKTRKEPTFEWVKLVRIIKAEGDKKTVVKEVEVKDGTHKTAEKVFKDFLMSTDDKSEYIIVQETVCRVVKE